jgi:hypothetical protein
MAMGEIMTMPPVLTSGVKCWFWVSAINAHGAGPWSNVVSARVK